MASSVVGNLVINLAADIGSFEAGLRKAQKENDRRMRRIEKRVGEFQRRFASSMKAVGAASAVAAAGLAVIIERQTQAVQRTHALAQAIGTSTGQLQAFASAFEHVGGNADKANDIIKDLQDKIGDASLNQGGELYQTLQNIGLSAENLVNKNPTQQLLDIADAISGLPKASQVNVLESVADDATLLLPLLRDGGKELKRFTEQAYKFGRALGPDQVKKMIEAGQVVQDFKDKLQGLSYEITIATAPAIEELGKTLQDPAIQKGLATLVQAFAKVVEWIAELSAKFANFVSSFGQQARRLLGIATGPIEKTQQKISELQEQLSQLPQQPTALGGGIVDRAGSNRRKQLEKELADQKRILADFKAQKKYFDDLYSGGTGENGDKPGYTPPKTPPYTPPATPEQTLQPQVLDVPDRPELSTQGSRDREALARIQEEVKTRQEQINEAYRHNVEIVDRAASSDEQRQELLTRLQERHAESIGRVNEQYDQMSAFAQRASENIQDQLGDTIEKTLSGHFDGILKSWVGLLQQMAAQAAAAQIGNALFGKQGANSGGGLLGTISRAAISGVSGYLGGGAATQAAVAGAYASGGNPPIGKASLVGEQGPELIVPRTPQTVIPNHALGGPASAAPVSVEFHLHNEGGQVQKKNVQAERRPDGKLIVRAWVKESISEMASNGELDDSLAPYSLDRKMAVT